MTSVDLNEVNDVEIDEHQDVEDNILDDGIADNDAGDSGEADHEVDDELVVTIGDEPPSEEVEEERKAPAWVKELRKKDRENVRRIRELEEQLKTKDQQPALKLGEKPTLESCEYDPDKYESSLATWFENKRKADEQQAKIEEETRRQQEEWANKLASYNEEKKKLKVRDFDDAEHLVKEKLTDVQQGIIIQGADNPALVIYALKVNPKKLAELSTIKDPVKYAFAVAKLEKDLKVTTKKDAPPPERKISGSGSTSAAIDSQLDRLRKEAERTGDYSKVMAYKRNLKK